MTTKNTNKIEPVEQYKNYRRQIGFTNQDDVKDFFGAKDIVPSIDLSYLQLLNKRLYHIVDKINFTINPQIQVDDLEAFKKLYIDRPFEIIKDSGILPTLNNQGRRPEQVYFSWMRGYIISNYFLKALGFIFDANLSDISLIGDDDLFNEDTFNRTPKADLEIKLADSQKLRIEMQSGFTGINDIKKHKVIEAKKVLQESGIHTLVIHFDLYNGQVAFVKVSQITDGDLNWVTRQQMEGQTVFSIDQKYFIWNLTEIPPKYCSWKEN